MAITIVRQLFLAAVLAVPVAAAGTPAPEPQARPQNAREDELRSVRDRLLTSLFFRGELADLMIDAGMASEFTDVQRFETNAELRGALIVWIRRNPDRSAEVYLQLKGGGGRPGGAPLESYEITWQANPAFLAMIKNLNDAAGNSAVPGETLELAARRLYEGPQAEAAPAVVRAGGGQAGGKSGIFDGTYADYKLNKAGLDKEVAAAAAWLAAAGGPGGRGPAGLEKDYSAAMREYAAFVVAASSVKGRSVVTAAESGALEAGRSELRRRLAALALRSRAADLDGIAAALSSASAEPGAARLLADLAALKVSIGASASAVENGDVPFAGLARLARAADDSFSALYLRYSAYNGLLALKRRSGPAGYSCFYDYALYRFLAAFFPAAAYPRAAAELAGAGAPLDAALEAAGAGDMDAAVAALGDRFRSIKEAAALRARASAFNRAAQFFGWGLLFRPAEVEAARRGNGISFRPAWTICRVAGHKK